MYLTGWSNLQENFVLLSTEIKQLSMGSRLLKFSGRFLQSLQMPQVQQRWKQKLRIMTSM